MQEKVKAIFETNKKLLGLIDKAVAYIRECEYELALENVAETGELINIISASIIKDREYFKSVSVEAVEELLESILEAKKKKDYILLADLYEKQLVSFICMIQELIIKQEDYLAFDENLYNENISKLISKLGKTINERKDLLKDSRELMRVNLEADLVAPLEPEIMLKEGFTLEFTSSGKMTMAAPFNSDKIYLHTNGNVEKESFLLAKHWTEKLTDEYMVYGFGMGYHIEQLRALEPEKHITIYESDLNVLKLYCAFGGECEALWLEDIDIVYDPDFRAITRKLAECESREYEGDVKLLINPEGKKNKICVHYPSYRRTSGCTALDKFVPWAAKVEQC